MSDALAELTAEVKRRVSELGFELVDLRRGGTKNLTRLQLRLDRPDAVPGHGITIDECTTVSRALEAWLDGSGKLGPRYVLEVSSPGIERPIRWLEHWARFTGRAVRVTLPEHGRISATIQAVDENAKTIVLRPDRSGTDITVAHAEVRDANLAVDWNELRLHHK